MSDPMVVLGEPFDAKKDAAQAGGERARCLRCRQPIQISALEMRSLHTLGLEHVAACPQHYLELVVPRHVA